MLNKLLVLSLAVLFGGCIGTPIFSTLQADFELSFNTTNTANTDVFSTVSTGNLAVQGDKILINSETTYYQNSIPTTPMPIAQKFLALGDQVYEQRGQSYTVKQSSDDRQTQQRIAWLSQIIAVANAAASVDSTFAEEVDGVQATRVSLNPASLPAPFNSPGVRSVTVWKRNLDSFPLKIQVIADHDQAAQGQTLGGTATEVITIKLKNIVTGVIDPDVFSPERQFVGLTLTDTFEQPTTGRNEVYNTTTER